MSNVQLIFTIAFGILFCVLPYFIGLYVCKKVEILKKNINKFSIIVASLILVPLIMVYRNPSLFYAIGWSIAGPFLITVIVHSIYLAWKNQYSSTKIAKNKGKTKSILNDDFYYGYSGTLLAAYLIGFIQP